MNLTTAPRLLKQIQANFQLEITTTETTAGSIIFEKLRKLKRWDIETGSIGKISIVMISK